MSPWTPPLVLLGIALATVVLMGISRGRGGTAFDVLGMLLVGGCTIAAIALATSVGHG